MAKLAATFSQRADVLYSGYRLRRVYYSGFSPIPEPSSLLPIKPPPLVREHRRYQADWLLRFYDFKFSEIVTSDAPHLDLALDPKLAWALRHRARFPADLNRSPREVLLRVPGLGMRNVDRIVAARRYCRLQLADLLCLRVPMKQALPFIIAADHTPARPDLDGDTLRQRFLPPQQQMELSFAAPPPTAADNALEDLWRACFKSIFNPARPRAKRRRREMPKKCWKNLPEAPLIADSASRVRDMLATEEREAKPAPRNAYLESLRRKSKPES